MLAIGSVCVVAVVVVLVWALKKAGVDLSKFSDEDWSSWDHDGDSADSSDDD